MLTYRVNQAFRFVEGIWLHQGRIVFYLKPDVPIDGRSEVIEGHQLVSTSICELILSL